MAINCCRRAPLPQRPHHPLATLPSLATHHRLSDPHQHLPRRRFRHHRPLLPFLLSRKVTIPATATAMAIASPRPLPHTTTSCAQSAATTKCRPTTLPRRSARQPMKTATMIPRMVATALQTSWVISWTRTRTRTCPPPPLRTPTTCARSTSDGASSHHPPTQPLPRSLSRSPAIRLSTIQTCRPPTFPCYRASSMGFTLATTDPMAHPSIINMSLTQTRMP